MTPGIKRSIGFVVCALTLGAAGVVCADDAFTLRSGAVEVGAGGAFTSVEGTTSGSLGLHAGYVRTPGGVILRYRAGWDYMRVSDLDLIDMELAVNALLRVGGSSAHPFLGVSAGIRQEWVGSFSQGRFPVGFDVGVIAMTSTNAHFSGAYEFRRILDDPVNDYNEHRIVIAMSIVFRNE